MEEEDDKSKVVKIAIPKSSEEGEDEDSVDCYEIDPIEFDEKLRVSFSDGADEDEGRDEDEGGDEDEGVVVLSEKGPVALRDYPHPRHLCGNFPFGRTTHETYCSKCFCNVCEVAAPCMDWWGSDGHCSVPGKQFHNQPYIIFLG